MLVAVEIFTLMSETEVEVKNCGWGGSVWSKHCQKKTKMDPNSVFTLFNPDGPGLDKVVPCGCNPCNVPKPLRTILLNFRKILSCYGSRYQVYIFPARDPGYALPSRRCLAAILGMSQSLQDDSPACPLSCPTHPLMSLSCLVKRLPSWAFFLGKHHGQRI